VHYASGAFREGELRIPAPPDSVAGWPLVGEPLHEFWALAAENLTAAVKQMVPYLKGVSTWLLSVATGAGVGLLEFIGSILVAGILLVYADTGRRTAVAVFTRFAGERGPEYADLARSTVRSVATGIVGVALIQALLAGIGLLAAGIPGAGLWALLCLLLCIIQLGPGLVLVPAVIYVFYTGDTATAVIFLIWSIFVTVIDNVLKPLLLGRGVKVPIVVIFLGAIGGFLAMGILGLFVGSVVLVLGFRLFNAWLEVSAVGSDRGVATGGDE
jgi:predicted PurR-regulated permease PerM